MIQVPGKVSSFTEGFKFCGKFQVLRKVSSFATSFKFHRKFQNLWKVSSFAKSFKFHGEFQVSEEVSNFTESLEFRTLQKIAVRYKTYIVWVGKNYLGCPRGYSTSRDNGGPIEGLH